MNKQKLQVITHKSQKKSKNKSESKSKPKPRMFTVKDNSFLSYEKKDDRTSLQHRSYIWDYLSLKKQDIQFENKYDNVSEFTIVQKEFKSGTSQITFLKNIYGEIIVKKEFVYYDNPRRRPFNPTESYANELNSLKLLYKCEHFPQLLYYNDDDCSIYMTYCGNHINIQNVPLDWKQQLITIYQTLKEKNIYNNDVYINNFCIKDGIISLIDFGLAKQHIDFCFYNLTLHDIEKATSMEDLNQLIKLRADSIYSTLYSCY